MKILRKKLDARGRLDQLITVIPFGDIHWGSKACDEKLVDAVIKRISGEENTYWIGMGDMCEFINKSDKRFDARILADWISVSDISSLSWAQSQYALKKLRPIAHKCLDFMKGNHEGSIMYKYEFDIYNYMVAELKKAANTPEEETFGGGIYSWMLLNIATTKTATRTIRFNIHHGFTGGKLDGAKALNMQRWLWNHDCDICLMGHAHNTMTQKATVEKVDDSGNVYAHTRRGAYTGTFLRTTVEDAETYSERKGYYPLPIGGIEVNIRPSFYRHRSDRFVRIES